MIPDLLGLGAGSYGLTAPVIGSFHLMNINTALKMVCKKQTS